MHPPKYIPLTDCVAGHLYRLHSRNLVLGVFDGKDGFVGVRHKFGERFLSTEYHWDTGPPHGTACPLEDVGSVPEGTPLGANLPTVCERTGRLVFYDFNFPHPLPHTPNFLGAWLYADTQEPVSENLVTSPPNKTLWDLILPLDEAERARP